MRSAITASSSDSARPTAATSALNTTVMRTERKVRALWAAIERALATGDWRPRPSRLCDWCDHRALCPSFGGTPPPLPAAHQP